MSSLFFWFRRDLRLEDNAGLFYALRDSIPVLPIFIFDKNILENRKLLIATMKEVGFKHIRTEWWHYSYIYPVKYRNISEMLWNCDEETENIKSKSSEE